MKICVFSAHFGGGYGTGHSIKKEVDELISRGHEVLVVHSEKNIKSFVNKKIKYFYFQYSKIPFLGILILKKQLDRIFKEITKDGIDIIYVQTLEFGLVNNNIFINYPLVYFARSTIMGVEKNKPREYWIDAIRRKFIVPILILLEKKCLLKSTAIVVKSDRMKNELNQLYKISFEKIRVIRGGLDLNDFRKKNEIKRKKIRKKLFVRENDKLILFTGRIVPVKGLYYLLIAFARLIKVRDNIRLIIVGQSMMSRYSKLIRKVIRRYKIDDFIVFTGYASQKEMYKYYNSCDIVVVPSTYEPFGMVNIQAVALNKPLISTNIAGSIEVIKDYPSLIMIPPFDAKKIEEAMTKLLTTNRKAKLFNVKRLLQPMSWNEMVNNLEKLFISQVDDFSIDMVTKII